MHLGHKRRLENGSARAILTAAGSIAAAALVVWMLPASAQDQAAADAGMKIWQRAGCAACHGTFAEGGGGGDQPAGPTLRRTRLDRAGLVETIGCGRPGTAMPYHLKGAYAETACYGLPLAAAGKDLSEGVLMSGAEINSLVDYLTARIVGKGAVTKAECGVYYANPNLPNCAAFR